MSTPGPSNGPMRVSLVISLALHAGVLFVIQEALPHTWFTKPLQAYRVEFLRPPVDPLIEPQGGGADLAGPQKPKKLDKTEDTISLNTKDKRYVSYARIIKAALMRHWQYPPKARERLLEGEVSVLFTLNSQGQLMGMQVFRPSLHGILDTEALRAIRSAAPFPPFPDSVSLDRLHVKARFDYRLTPASP